MNTGDVLSLKLASVTLCGDRAVVATKNRSPVWYASAGKLKSTPLDLTNGTVAVSLHAPFVEDATALVCDKSIRIVTVNSTVSSYTGTTQRLKATPRRVITDAERQLLYVVEGDNCSKNVDEELQVGEEGQWTGFLRTFDLTTDQTVELLDLDDECLTTAGIVSFESHPGVSFLVVGTCRGMKTRPRTWEECRICLYEIRDKHLVFHHATVVDRPVRAVAEFMGKLIVGIGNTLRM